MIRLDIQNSGGIVVLAAILVLVPWLVLDARGGARRVVAGLLSAAALFVLATNALTWVLNDDEVFYLADSWAAHVGDTQGALPLRYLAFRPFLWLPRPSLAIVATRTTAVLMTVLCALAVARAARRLGALDAWPAAAGALTAIWLATTAQSALLRPEGFAAAAFVSGGSLLIAPSTRLRGSIGTALAFVLLTLAGTISHRQAPLVVAALAVALWRPPAGASRGTTALAALAGIFAAGLPSLVYVACCDSFASLWYWNWTFVLHHSWVADTQTVARLPLFLCLVAVPAAIVLLARTADGGVQRAAVLWLLATVHAALFPFVLPYALGPWLALSVLVSTITLATLAARARPWPLRVAACALALLAAPLAGHGGLRVVHGPRLLGSQLALLDWLHEVAGAGPVACVSPYHPLQSANAWKFWNAWWYCYLRDPSFVTGLDPGLVTDLASGAPRVIAWDPWPEASGFRSVIQFATGRGFLPRDRAPALTAALARQYRLVRWNLPLPPDFGGGRFLVSRAVVLDDRVSALDDRRIVP